ncbi:MAG TPA: collagenase-like protease, partial [Desulfobacteraceae bacterium]|nr:collagenase-like protease [Desulfobacteraceae bacterium]
YPETELSYSGNVLNQKAKKFYQRHGVVRIMPAAESGVDMHGKKVMTTKYCLNYEFGRCSGKPPLTPTLSPIGEREALYLTDEDGRKFRLDFDCVNCEMAVFYEKPF